MNSKSKFKQKLLSIVIIVVLLCSLQAFAYARSYSVQWGDSLWKIAVKFQVGLSEIITANPQIKNPNLIYPKQVLNIPNISDVQTLETEVVKLVNAERSKRGLQTLQQDWQVSRVARYKSQDMINKGYFAHQSPTFGSPFKMMESFNIKFSAAAENIAYGQRTPQEVMNSWMNSPGHRNNILSPIYTHMGCGLARSKSGVAYWTQMFYKK